MYGNTVVSLLVNVVSKYEYQLSICKMIQLSGCLS